MEMMRKYFNDNKVMILGYAIMTLVFSIILYLYNLPQEPIIYANIICITIFFVYSIYKFLEYSKQVRKLEVLKKSIVFSIDGVGEPTQEIERMYVDLLTIVFNDKIFLQSKSEEELKEMVDYYTLWAHQIKTPISAMKIVLQSEESLENNSSKQLLNELFKIEQYVEMVLGYLRMGNISGDLLLKEYSLDDMVKQAVRKYARLFIGKNISLDLKELNTNVLTDEKWLVFVLEQLISNSIKYSKGFGKISIYMDKSKNKTLIIDDKGIGIEKEDLPRIFEKGFTGFNGREDKKSTGIGLYLCKNILNKLSHSIEVESEVSKGTKIKINLETINLTKV